MIENVRVVFLRPSARRGSPRLRVPIQVTCDAPPPRTFGHWVLFVLVSGLFILAGGLAIVVPAISSIAPNEVLGLVLMLVGLAQIVQPAEMERNSLFT